MCPKIVFEANVIQRQAEMMSKQRVLQFCLLLLQMTDQQTCAARWKRFLNGDYIIGGLFPVTSGLHCEKINEEGLIQVEALVFAVEMVNRNSTFLGNNTLGYDLRDTCKSVQIASEQTMNLVGERNKEKNRSEKEISSDRIVAVIGPFSYQAVIAAGGILSSRKIIQVRNWTAFNNKAAFKVCFSFIHGISFFLGGN